MRPRLRIFTGEDDADLATASQTVPMKLGELVEVLGDAKSVRRTWMEDFANDEVQVPEDLYEVMTAYWRLRPGA